MSILDVRVRWTVHLGVVGARARKSSADCRGHRPVRGWWELERENLQLIVEVIDPLTVNPTHRPFTGVPFLIGAGGVGGGVEVLEPKFFWW
jgi:hypothetical protein